MCFVRMNPNLQIWDGRLNQAWGIRSICFVASVVGSEMRTGFNLTDTIVQGSSLRNIWIQGLE